MSSAQLHASGIGGIGSSSAALSSTHVNSRFSLILLEPGEIYYEDYLVYYHDTVSPLARKITSPNSSGGSANRQILKGNLKICSKSIVFDPLNVNYPLIKFSFKSIEKIHMSVATSTDDTTATTTNSANSTASNSYSNLAAKCFALQAKQRVLCKSQNKIGPYVNVRRERPDELHYFQLLFTTVDDSLDLLAQLHRASTLDYEQEELMLQLILRSRLARDSAAASCDAHHLDDMFREQIQLEALVNKINPLCANPGKLILTNMCLYYKPFNNLDNEHRLLKIKLSWIKFVIKRRYHLKRVGCEIVFEASTGSSSAKAAAEALIGRSRSRSSPLGAADESGDSVFADDLLLSEQSSETAEEAAAAATAANVRALPYLYVTFDDEATRDLFYTRLVVDQRDKLTSLSESSPANMLQKWRYGAISNYDYLMYLNSMADRSYNDLTQYPVFPWVLADYTSDTLDLNDTAVFRDLSKPIGALNDERLGRLRQRCKEMQAATTGFDQQEKKHHNTDQKKEQQQQPPQPVFLYGSHYSTPAFVLYYLVRQEPEWQLCLQNGRFDHPNRLFHSVADTWRNCLNIDSDVKELIPEFYDTVASSWAKPGDFLLNTLELDLGVRQADGVRVNHVKLPRWTQGRGPAYFVARMRDALESGHVSRHLHEWVDLIFGYKQRGAAALAADNLFYYLCYEGSVDLDAVSAYSERKSLEMQIQEFGQIPSQLFVTPHLPRVKFDLVGEVVRFSINNDDDNYDEENDNELDNNVDIIDGDVNIYADDSGGIYGDFEKAPKETTTKTTSLLIKQRSTPRLSAVSSTPAIRRVVSPIDSSRSVTPPSTGKRAAAVAAAAAATQAAAVTNPYAFNATNFKRLTCTFSVKLHKGQVNDCLFIETGESPEQNTTTQNHYFCGGVIDNSNGRAVSQRFQLPLVCSVSNDCWIKIYSLEDRSLFRSHNVSGFNLSTVDCVQVPAPAVDRFNLEDSSTATAATSAAVMDDTDDYIRRFMEPSVATSPSSPSSFSPISESQAPATTAVKPNNESATATEATGTRRTLVFLSCWDNSLYVYDMNYNRCIHSSIGAHDDAITRVRLVGLAAGGTMAPRQRTRGLADLALSNSAEQLVLTSSWDSQIKVWRVPIAAPVNLNAPGDSAMRLEYLSELTHDAAVLDFQLSPTLLAALCEDGNLCVWRINYRFRTPSSLSTSTSASSADSLGELDMDNLFTFLYALPSSCDIGKIVDCKLVDSLIATASYPGTDAIDDTSSATAPVTLVTLAICTTLGFVKIYNAHTKSELFSLRLSQPSMASGSAGPSFARLNKLYYELHVIITVDAHGHVYFIDLEQVRITSSSSNSATDKLVSPVAPSSSSTSFLRHTIKLSSTSLSSLNIYKDSIVCVGDNDGTLYFLSLFEF